MLHYIPVLNFKNNAAPKTIHCNGPDSGGLAAAGLKMGDYSALLAWRKGKQGRVKTALTVGIQVSLLGF